MRFECERSRLADVAGLVAQAVSGKSTKKIFECTRIRAMENGLELAGTDLEVAVRYTVEGARVEEPGEIVVPAALLANVLREIGDESVSLHATERKLELRTDGGHFQIEGEDPAEYPEIPEYPEEAAGTIESEDLRALVRKTSFAAGREAARFVLNGVKVIVDGEAMRFVATDGRRLATLARPFQPGKAAEGRPTSAIVPVKGLQHIERAAAEAGGTAEFAITSRHVAVRTGSAEVTARTMEGTFPEYDQIVPKSSKGTAKVPTGVLSSRLRQTNHFASVESQSVVLHFKEGELSISAAGDDGRAEVRLGIEYEGAEERVGFNPAFLIDALKVVDGEALSIGITDRNSAAKITDDSGFLYVVMPVLID